jgi:hypothetical protein
MSMPAWNLNASERNVRGAADAARSERVFSGRCLGHCDEFGGVADRQIGIGHEHQREPRHQRDAGEVGQNVVAGFLVHERQRGMAGAWKQERGAVGVGLRHHAGRDRAAGAAHVLHQHALRQLLAQALGEDAGHQINAAAGSDRHHQLERP